MDGMKGCAPVRSRPGELHIFFCANKNGVGKLPYHLVSITQQPLSDRFLSPMLQQSYKKYETVPFGISLVLLLAFAGVLMTLGQVALIVYSGDILCLNQGCEIVESLTRIPPLYFNLAGCGYFLLLLFLFYKGRGGARFWLNSGRLLAAAGMAAEGVLVAFQHYVAEVFCSYCLIILATIFLINLFVGLRQLFTGLVMFSSVFIAFSALQFSPAGQGEPADIATGTFARLDKEQGREVYLFFSETCPHCEDVIASLGADLTCTVNFNPVGSVSGVGVEGVARSTDYSPEVNKTYLKTLGIREIPVLVSQEEFGLQVHKGKSAITAYLNAHCYPQSEPEQAEDVYSGESSGEGMSVVGQSPAAPYFFQPAPEEEGCAVEEDCEPVQEGTAQ